MPVIEEIDDDEIDSKHFSLAEFDPHNPFSRDMPVEEGAPVQLRPTQAGGDAVASRAAPAARAPSASAAGASAPARGGGPAFVSADFGAGAPPGARGRELPEHMKQWKVIYPVYFDKTRTLREGRRVPYEQAVHNPLAVTISEACIALGYEAAIELTKQHPKDWANPGRVRVHLPAGRAKREVYKEIAAQLKATPVTPATAREDMYRRIATFDSLKPLATPRNMRFPSVLPGVSPALSARKTIDESMKMDGNAMAKMMGMG